MLVNITLFTNKFISVSMFAVIDKIYRNKLVKDLTCANLTEREG